jgi:hypothetical protein
LYIKARILLLAKGACASKVPFEVRSRNTNRRGRLSTVYLLLKLACFVNKLKM